MKKNLTKNIPLKIMSVVVGILVWLIVVNVDNPIVTKGFSDFRCADYQRSVC